MRVSAVRMTVMVSKCRYFCHARTIRDQDYMVTPVQLELCQL
ncbi:hypothetical protein [Bacillus horti]|uniref:Uncharacterized protein n=1 Tax=Caldalkalibacillus horti TaxID=77523 RepID=A0ABT9VVM5_9BACI|nr:hypothetical protein [Bacillus horti]